MHVVTQISCRCSPIPMLSLGREKESLPELALPAHQQPWYEARKIHKPCNSEHLDHTSAATAMYQSCCWKADIVNF